MTRPSVDIGDNTPAEAVTDAELRHLCKLGAIAVSGLRDRDDWLEYIRSADMYELRSHHTCLLILSRAFVELMNRTGMKPTFQFPLPPAEAG